MPFWVAAGLSFANALYGWLILPESLPPDRRSPWRWKAANPVGAVHLLRTNRVLAGLSVANFFAQLAHAVLPSVFVLYATYRYGWSTSMVGATLAAVGICQMVVQGAAIGPIVRRLGERRALLLGFACGTIGFFIFAAAPTGLLSWVGIPFMALWGLAGASAQALTTRLVTPEQQGQLQGATMSVASVAQLLGPFLFTLTFAYFIGATAPFKLPGAPFFLASALLLLALVISVRTLAVGAAVDRLTIVAPCLGRRSRLHRMQRSAEAIMPIDNVADLIAETLIQAGVKRVYGVVGDSLNGLTEALRKRKTI